MNDTLLVYLTSKIKPTILPLFQEVINYLNDINYLDDKEELEALMAKSIKGEITDDTETLNNILLTYLLEIASQYGIVFNTDVITLRVLFDILATIDNISTMGINDKVYIKEILDVDDMSITYKLINILFQYTLHDNVTISEAINDVTPMFINTLYAITNVDPDSQTDDENIARLLTLLLNLDVTYTPIGCRILGDSGDIDVICNSLVIKHWDEVNVLHMATEIYSLLILGRDSREKPMEYFKEYLEELVEPNIIKEVYIDLTKIHETHHPLVRDFINSLTDED